MKKILFIILTICTIRAYSQNKQPYTPFRTNGNVMVKDSALAIGQALIPTYSTPSLGVYSDRWGQSFGIDRTNGRLTVRGNGVWLTYPNYNEIVSMLSVNPSMSLLSAPNANSEVYQGDLNILEGSKSVFAGSSATNKPNSSTFHIQQYSLSSTVKVQFAQKFSSVTDFYYRIQNTTWGGWIRLYTDGTVVPVANGGTGRNTVTSGAIQKGAGTSALVDAIAGTDYVAPSRTFNNGYGILGLGDLSADRTPRVDTANIVAKNYLAALNGSLVHLAGTETIAGIKTFSAKTNHNAGWGTTNSSNTVDNGTIFWKNGTFGINIGTSAPPASNKTQTLQDKDGVIANISDIPVFANYLASGTGAATTITIPHGLSNITTNSKVIVQPLNAASAGVSYATIGTTNVSITYTVAPANGTNNLNYSILITP